MRAIIATQPGNPDVLRYEETTGPSPGPDQVLVRVTGIGVNYIDTYRRSGIYPFEFPGIPGSEGAGVVEAFGSDVTSLSVSDRVAWVHSASGSYAELALVEERHAVPVPDEVPDDVAAALLLQGLTAHYLATSTFPISAEQTVLIHAGAGGVGLLLTQLAVARGARVIATTSTDAKAELSRAAGAHHVIRYDLFDDVTTELPAAVRSLTDDRGVHTVYDGVGKATFEASLDSLRPRGGLALFGAASGPVPPFDPQDLNSKGSLFLTRPSLGAYVATREELISRTDALFAAVMNGTLKVRIGSHLPLSEAAAAHAALESRATTGKTILIP